MSQPASPRSTTQIGDLLRNAGLVTEDQIERALALKKQRGIKLGQALLELGFIDESGLAAALREQGRFQCIHLTPGIVDRDLVHEFGEERARRMNALPINRIAGVVTVAMEDPTDVFLVDELSKHFGARVFAVHGASSRIADATDAAFRAGARPSDQVDELVAITAMEAGLEVDGEPEVEGRDDLDQPVINLVRSVLKEAFDRRASDIHFEPRRDQFVIRLRTDGVLQDRVSLKKGWARPTLARIKIMANLDIAQSRLPQDGRAQVVIDGARVDMRIATTPSLRGEGAVVRILDGGRTLLGLHHLGLEARQLRDIHQMVDGAQGFVLATGPTGSGKTATLYGILQHLMSPERKIITLEDPVENELEGATQINTHAKIGLSFATGLRSILRQDPDIVLVGEVRDQETAEIAIQAAQTGHLVLSTLHTVGAVEAIVRLQDMGIASFQVADTLNGVIAQRLLRRVCSQCRAEAKPEPGMLKALGLEPGDGPFYAGAGCQACSGTGYRGRVGIFEILRTTNEIREKLGRGASSEELRRAAASNGMATLRLDGLRRVREGASSLAELYTTVGAEMAP